MLQQNKGGIFVFFEQFDMLCKSNNTTPTEFVKNILQLSTSKVTLWKNGSLPKPEVLTQIAKYFNVSVGYLFDGETRYDSIPLDEQQLLTDYRTVDSVSKAVIRERAKTLAEQAKSNKNNG